MESDNEILGVSEKVRYSTMDVSGSYIKDSAHSQHHKASPRLPQRSRSMMNLSSTHSLRRHSWLLPESPTVAEKQVQLTKRKGLSGALSPPPPKVPSVRRYLEIFEKLKSAYSGFLRSWEEVNRSSLSVKEHLHFDKTKKKLVAKLQKIEDLYDLYVHQDHMRKGAKKLLDTIERESSKSVKSGKHYCKASLKKNLSRLCDVENEINDMAGSMKIHIIGLIGFARLSPGDVYSVQLKHGYEKLYSKCKVVGQAQKWTISELSIKINPANDLILKVSEVRKVSANAVGEITCPIGNFLSADGQEFVLPVNSTGTLKLKISVFWNPFSSKGETALYGKLIVSQMPMKRLDSLSESSRSPSPCSTPRNGTLSSMPSLMATNGTLSSMKISVNGTYLSPEASVIKHSKIESSSDQSDGNLKSLLAVKSLPNIVSSCENETANRDQLETSSRTYDRSLSDNNNRETPEVHHSSSCDFTNEKTMLRDLDYRGKKKLRPVTMNPTFTNGISYQSDYENVVNLISTSILGEKPDLIPKEETKPKSKQRPKSVAVPYKPVPIPDYPVDFSFNSKSPELSHVKSIPVSDEPDYSPISRSPASSFSSIPPPPNQPAPSPPSSPQAQDSGIPVTGIDTPESRETSSNHPSTKEEKNSNIADRKTVLNSSSSNVVVVSIAKTETQDANANSTSAGEITEVDDNDEELLRRIRALLLNMMVDCNQFNAELEARLDSLKEVLEEITHLLQEKKPLARTSSIENALNSIDSAFDFLSEHQTLKPEKKPEKENSKVCLNNWNLLRKVLHHHLKATRYMIEKLLSLESPLGIKKELYVEKLLAQAEVLHIISKSLTSDDTATPKFVASDIDRTKLAGSIWEKHCSKQELICNKDKIRLMLNQIYVQFQPGITPSNEVCEETLERIQNDNIYGEDSDSVSLFQFAMFIARIRNLSIYFETVSKERRVQKAFNSGDDLVIISVMQERQSIPVVPNVLKMVASFLQSDNRTIQKVAGDFLAKLSVEAKKKAIDVYLTMVEDDDATVRAAVCTALKCLEASKAQESLAFLWKNDVENVRKAAFEALEVVGFPAGFEPEIAGKNLQRSEVSTKF